MLKILGSICVLSSGGLVWWICMSGRRRKREILLDLLRCLHCMGEEIRMVRTPLPLLLEIQAADCRTKEVETLFFQTAQMARSGEGVKECWRNHVEVLPLSSEEKEVLLRLELTGDEENICKGISLVVNGISRIMEDVEKKRPEEVKRITALCFSAAALLLIVLI